MSLVIRDASPSEKRGNAMSAALAKEQLQYAVQIVRDVLPQSAGDTALIGAVVQAIAMNYAAVPQPIARVGAERDEMFDPHPSSSGRGHCPAVPRSSERLDWYARELESCQPRGWPPGGVRKLPCGPHEY